jgi:hypothetical protein
MAQTRGDLADYILQADWGGRRSTRAALHGLATGANARPLLVELEPALSRSRSDPTTAAIIRCLADLLALEGRSRRCAILDFLTVQARRLAVYLTADDDDPQAAALVAVLPTVIGLFLDPAPAVRARAATTAGAIAASSEISRRDAFDSGVRSTLRTALRLHVSTEQDPHALAAAIRALAGMGTLEDHAAADDLTAIARQMLAHPAVEVRLAALLCLPDPDDDAPSAHDAPDRDRPAHGAAATRGDRRAPARSQPGPRPALPWYQHRGYFIRDEAIRLAAHPHRAADLAKALAQSPDAAQRVNAMTLAAELLSLWRRPPDGLWELVLDTLTDADAEPRNSAGAIVARAGETIAPFTGRLIEYLDSHRCDLTGTTGILAHLAHPADKVLTALRRLGVEPPGPALRPDGKPYADQSAEGQVAELTDMLNGPIAHRAADELGSRGPAAAAAAGILADLARSTRTPPRPCGSVRTDWPGRQAAAWAHWRITADPQLALPILGAAAEAGYCRPALRYLGDLGPLAAAHAHAVRALIELPGQWNQIESAYAHWRLTGHPSPAVPALARHLRGLSRRDFTPACIRAMRYLGQIGPDAAEAEPELTELLTVLLTAPRRIGRTVLEDEELLQTARQALQELAVP